jgi:hypothetical protein
LLIQINAIRVFYGVFMVTLDFISRDFDILSVKMTKIAVFLISFCSTPAFAQNNIYDYPILDLYDGQKIEMTVDGQSVTAFTAPGMPSNLTISNTLAQSIFGKGANKFASTFERILAALAKDEFDTAPPQYIQARIGPVKIRGQQRPVKVSLGGGRADNKLVRWYQTDEHKFGEALAGPYAIPAPVIRFTLRPAQPGEIRFSMPLMDEDKRGQASTRMVFGKTKVYFAFAPHFETTLASAAAGSVIAQNYGGEFVGDPKPVVVAYNIARPARPVQLKTPIAFGPVALSKLLVRSRDYGETNAIKEAKSPDASEDEILVQAKRKGTNPEYFVYIGNDFLKNCSSITYDKPGKTVTLSCLPSN